MSSLEEILGLQAVEELQSEQEGGMEEDDFGDWDEAVVYDSPTATSTEGPMEEAVVQQEGITVEIRTESNEKGSGGSCSRPQGQERGDSTGLAKVGIVCRMRDPIRDMSPHPNHVCSYWQNKRKGTKRKAKHCRIEWTRFVAKLSERTAR